MTQLFSVALMHNYLKIPTRPSHLPVAYCADISIIVVCVTKLDYSVLFLIEQCCLHVVCQVVCLYHNGPHLYY